MQEIEIADNIILSSDYYNQSDADTDLQPSKSIWIRAQPSSSSACYSPPQPSLDFSA